mgnify:CR=1 FL=1
MRPVTHQQLRRFSFYARGILERALLPDLLFRKRLGPKLARLDTLTDPQKKDLLEKIDHYLAHPDEAEDIIANFKAHQGRFRDPALEELVGLLVARKYLELTGQPTGLPKV